MSNIVDDRIVNMRFDNSDFEKNVSTSMNTLDKLKQSLNFSDSGKSLEGLQNAANNFSMDKIEGSLEALRNRFSTLGIVGMTIIQNLTNSALGALSNISHKISSMIISGGISRAMNIENAKFQLEGLGIEYKDVFGAIDYAVTNTAYGLDAAAQAASQLSAAGLDYKNVIMTHKEDGQELTQMAMALRAVSGVAAQTQSEYSMVARYFQDVANAGKVTGATLTYMTQVLNLPVEQNLAEGLKAIADGSAEASESVQKAVKNLTKGAQVSTEQIKTWASKGLITFDMFSTVMFDKYADHAVAANRTISGVMANIRAAFSKIGAEFVSPLIEIDGIVVQMFESIRRRLNEIKPAIIPFAKSVTDVVKMIAGNIKNIVDNLDLTWLKPFFKGLSGVIDGLAKGITTFKSAWDAMFKSDRSSKLKSFAESLQDFGNKFKRSQDNLSVQQELYDKFKGFLSLLNVLKTVFNTLLQPFKGFIEGLKESIGLSGSFIDSFVNWATNLNKLVSESEKLKEISQRLFDAGKLIGTSISSLVSDVFNTFKSIKNGPTEFVKTIFDGLITDLGHTLIKIVEILTGKDLSKVVEIYDKVINVLKELTSALAEVFDGALDSIGNFLTSIGSLFSGVKIDDSVFSSLSEKIDSDLSPIEKIFTVFKKAFDGFLALIKSILPSIKIIGGNLLDTIVSIFDGIKKAFNDKTFGNSLRNTTFSVLLFNLKSVFVQLNKIIGKANPLKGLNNFVSQLKDTAFEMERNFNANYFLKIAGSVIMLAFAMNMIANIDSDRLEAATAVIITLLGSLSLIAKALSSSSAFNSESSGFLGLMKKVSKSGTDKSLISGMSGLISMAMAVILLAKAIKDIAEIEDPNALLNAVIAIEILLASLMVVAKMLSTNSVEEAKVMSGMSGFIAMAIAIKILALAAQDFASMDWGQLGKAGVGIGTLMVLLTAFSKIMESQSSKNGIFSSSEKKTQGMIQLGAGLVLLAAAIKIFASAAQEFGNMEWEELGKAGAAIGVLMIALTAFSKIMESKTTTGFMSSSKTQSANMIQLGIGLVLLGESMKLFAQAASSFAELDWEELGKAGAAFVTIIAGISVLSKLTSSSSMGFFNETNNLTKQNTSQNLITLGAGMIAIAAAMKIFASAAEDFALLNWAELGKAAVSMGALMVGLSLFSNFTSGGNFMKLSGGLMMFATAMLMLVPAIMAFGNLSLGGVILSLLEISGIILVLAGLTKLVGPMIGAINSLSLSLLLFGAALGVLGGGLILLSSGVAAASGSILAILGLIKTIIIGIVETIHELVPLIVETVVDIIDQFFISLKDHIPSIVDSILTIIIKVLEILKTRLPELASPIFDIVDSLAEIFKQQFGTLDVNSFLMAMAGISLFLLALAGSAMLAQKALLGIGAIMLVMAEVTAMFLLLSSIDANTTLAIAQGLSEVLLALSVSTAILTVIGVGAAAAVAGVAALGIFIAGIIAVLAALGGLKQIPGFEWLISEGMTILSQVGLAIGEFVGSIVSGIGVGLTSGLPEIADNLSNFMTRLTPFLDGLKAIDSSMMESALALSGIIIALTAADILDALTSWFTGGIDMSKFGEQIAAFGPYIVQFANSVRGINAQDVEAAANAGKALAEMASNLPNEGGVVGWFMGENDMAEFAKKLVPFGKAMKEYAATVSGLDVGVVENSAAAGKAVAELASSLPNSGGVAGWFMGENDMDKFGEQLVTFGKKLAAYAVYVDGLDEDVVINSANAGKAMSELANSLGNSGGVAGFFAGNNDIDDFGEKIVKFGKSLKEYSKSIAGMDVETVVRSATAGKALAQLANSLSNSGGVAGFFAGDNDIDDFGHKLISFGNSMREFSLTLIGVDLSMVPNLTIGVRGLVDLANYIAGSSTESLTAFAKDAKGFAEKFGSAGLKYVDSFLASFRNSIDRVSSEVEAFVQNLVNVLENRQALFMQEGTKSAMSFARGIKAGADDVKKAAESIASSAVSALSSAKNKAYGIGVDIINGLTAGLKDKDALSALLDRLHWLANLVEAGASEPLERHSPSKVFMRIGRDLVLGLAIGLEDYSYLAKDAAGDMAESTLEPMQKAINKINDYLVDGIDADPVITPVLDMSNLEENASRINEMFNRSIGVASVRASIIPGTDQPLSMLQNEQLDPKKFGTTFIQNNYSPKALSRTEIYRQTKNQFSAYREAFS